MKKYNINIIIVVLLLLFNSCKEFLNEVPDQRLELQKLSNLSEVLVNAYPEASYLFTEMYSDNVVAIPRNSQRLFMTRMFTYSSLNGVGENERFGPDYFWISSYKAIAHSNMVLEELEKVEGSQTKSNEKLKKAIKGEALITRAYNHFMLANIFCQHYSKSNASSLGIPYVTIPETKLTSHYKRNTLEDTYQKIERDLLEALPLISDDFYKSKKYHFNILAANAFASRFYLSKGDWDKSIMYADKVLGTGTISSSILKSMNVVFGGSSSSNYISYLFTNIKDFSNLMLARHYVGIGLRLRYGYRPSRPHLNYVFGIKEDPYSNPEFSNIQKTKDYRNSQYGNWSTGAITPPKFAELFEYVTHDTGLPFYTHTLFRTEEVMFNRLEARIRKNQLDNILNDYNVFASSRFEKFRPITQSQIVNFYKNEKTVQEAYLQFILDERRKEFFGEGLRWFDIKRFDIAIKHTDIYGNEFLLKNKDMRKAIQVPSYAVANGIKSNPN